MNNQNNNKFCRQLFVDVDGTLIASDLLYESVLALLRRNFFFLFLLPVWLLHGKANLKQQLASRVELRSELLPVNQPVLEYLQQQKSLGTKLFLISASNEKLVQKLADQIGIFETAIGSNASSNLRGKNKLERIEILCSGTPFDYIGDSFADLPVWNKAQNALLVNCNNAVKSRITSNISHQFQCRDSAFRAYIKANRPHQWLKNLLLFLPLILSHQLTNITLLLDAVVAFVSFSLCASSVYLLNDMLDLDFDRQHSSKKKRPFANGQLPLAFGFFGAPLQLLVAVVLALALSPVFFATLALYWFTTLVYSLYLKRLVLVDVLTLASLYTVRIIAGAAAISVLPTFWLLAFSMFLFMSLAIVKRYTELSNLKALGQELSQGRGYAASDLQILSSLGGSCGYMAVLVFALYINNPDTLDLYGRPEVLWLICPLLLYLISRIWLIAHRGGIDEDPIIFAITDRTSQLVTALCGVLVWLAI